MALILCMGRTSLPKNLQAQLTTINAELKINQEKLKHAELKSEQIKTELTVTRADITPQNAEDQRRIENLRHRLAEVEKKYKLLGTNRRIGGYGFW